MGDVDDGGRAALLAQAAVQVGDPHPHRGAKLGVEVRQGLVEQEDLRLLDQRAADGDALGLAARELLRAGGRAAPRSRALGEPRRRDFSISAFGVPRSFEAEGEVLVTFMCG